MQYKTAEVAARCKSLTRVNIYKNRVKLATQLPMLPNREALQVQLLLHHICLACLSTLFCYRGIPCPLQHRTKSGGTATIHLLQRERPCLFLSWCHMSLCSPAGAAHAQQLLAEHHCIGSGGHTAVSHICS